jgi:hypothetical protein
MPCAFTASTLEYALAEHRNARRHAEAADTAASLAAFYSSDLHHLDADDAGRRAESYRRKMAAESDAESRALRLLNATLLGSGAVVGEEVEVGMAVYRVCREGAWAAYLGAVPPVDMEPCDDETDEVAEMVSAYADAVRPAGGIAR